MEAQADNPNPTADTREELGRWCSLIQDARRITEEPDEG